MNPILQKLFASANKPSRKIIGLMSGTSLDGLDIALCELSGVGFDTDCTVLAFKTVPYEDAFKNHIKSVFAKKEGSIETLTLLNPFIAKQHASYVNQALDEWNISKEEVDVIASHGQTVYHAPSHQHQNPDFGHGTLQIGDGDMLAVETGIITISDFRQKHIAYGLEGAPLAQYGDYLLYRSDRCHRILLNMGGIANLTFLPKNADLNGTLCSDIGPANTLIDRVMQMYFDKPFDEGGAIAQSGNVNSIWLNKLEKHAFISAKMPKTTGPEVFNLEMLIQCGVDLNGDFNRADLVATLTQFTAKNIAKHIEALGVVHEPIELIISGGGAHNLVMIEWLSESLSNNVNIVPANQLGIDIDAKEAMLFALLANETLSGNDSSLPFSMGKICLPG